VKRRMILPIFLFLTSCSIGLSGHPVASRPVTPQLRVADNFTPRTTMMKIVGETMIERKNMNIYPGFEAAEDFKAPININNGPSPLIYKGTGWICQSFVMTDYYSCTKILGAGEFNYDLVIDRSGAIRGIALDASTRFLNFVQIVEGKLIPVDRPVMGSYKQVLIYNGISNGKSKDNIKVSYREYVGDKTSPAFSQDLTYDLSESREIAFRDLRIEVLEATNSSITFFVK